MLRELKLKTVSKVKAERYVPYTIAVNGASNPTLSDLNLQVTHVSYSDITKS